MCFNFFRLKDFELSQLESEGLGAAGNMEEINDLRKELQTLKDYSTEEINKLIQNQHQELKELR